MADQVKIKAGIDSSAIKSGLAHIKNQFAGLRTFGAGKIAGALGAVGLAAGVTAGIKDVLDLAGNLSDLRAQTGQSESDLLTLRQAFINAGLGSEVTGEMVNKVQNALAGTSLESASTVEQIAALQKEFAGIHDPVARTTRAYELFGKAGGKMLRILGDPTALDTARQQVGGLGETMTRYAADMDSLGDAIGGLKTKQQQFFAAMLSSGLPQLNDSIEKLNQLDLTNLGNTAGVAAGAIADGVVKFVEAAARLNKIFDEILKKLFGEKAPELSRPYTREELDRNHAAKQQQQAQGAQPAQAAKKAEIIADAMTKAGGGGVAYFAPQAEAAKKSAAALESMNQEIKAQGHTLKNIERKTGWQ